MKYKPRSDNLYGSGAKQALDRLLLILEGKDKHNPLMSFNKACETIALEIGMATSSVKRMARGSMDISTAAAVNILQFHKKATKTPRIKTKQFIVAVECGSEELRDLIRKALTNEERVSALKSYSARKNYDGRTSG